MPHGQTESVGIMSIRRRLLEPVRPDAVLPDRALCLASLPPSLSLSLSLSLASRQPFPGPPRAQDTKTALRPFAARGCVLQGGAAGALQVLPTLTVPVF